MSPNRTSPHALHGAPRGSTLTVADQSRHEARNFHLILRPLSNSLQSFRRIIQNHGSEMQRDVVKIQRYNWIWHPLLKLRQ